MKDPTAFDFDGDYGAGYEDLARTVIPGYDQVFQSVLAIFRRQLEPLAQILIAGCGTGRELATLGPAHSGWRFVAVDPSIEMVRVTADLVQRQQLQTRVRLHHGYVHDLPPNDRYDAATIINVLHFLQDDGEKQALVNSVSTRLRIGAPLVLFDLHGDPMSVEFRTLRDAWYEFIELRGLTADSKARFIDRLDRGIAYVPETRILDICRDAGLELRARFYGGFLYGGWLLARGAT